jgi:histidine triad (HIT) family protein
LQHSLPIAGLSSRLLEFKKSWFHSALYNWENFSPMEFNMDECIFCKIINGHAPATTVYKDEEITAFLDIHPVAPTHILIVPNKHITSVNEVHPEDEPVMGRLFSIARELAKKEGIAQNGYRLIVNTGTHGGQVVYHLHMHLMGGQRMRHPIG